MVHIGIRLTLDDLTYKEVEILLSKYEKHIAFYEEGSVNKTPHLHILILGQNEPNAVRNVIFRYIEKRFPLYSKEKQKSLYCVKRYTNDIKGYRYAAKAQRPVISNLSSDEQEQIMLEGLKYKPIDKKQTDFLGYLNDLYKPIQGTRDEVTDHICDLLDEHMYQKLHDESKYRQYYYCILGKHYPHFYKPTSRPWRAKLRKANKLSLSDIDAIVKNQVKKQEQSYTSINDILDE